MVVVGLGTGVSVSSHGDSRLGVPGASHGRASPTLGLAPGKDLAEHRQSKKNSMGQGPETGKGTAQVRTKRNSVWPESSLDSVSEKKTAKSKPKLL